MDFRVTDNVSDVLAFNTRLQKQQLPFATALALTKTAQKVKEAEYGLMKKVFEGPTKYTLNALQMRPAKKTKLEASVGFKEGHGRGVPAKRFLNPHVHGIARSQKSHEKKLAPVMRGKNFTVPARGAKLNKSGNITGGTYMQILSRLKLAGDQSATNSGASKRKQRAKTYFVPKAGSKLRAGVYERTARGVKPILIFIRSPRYTKRFPFYNKADQLSRALFPAEYKKAMDFAIATARPPK